MARTPLEGSHVCDLTGGFDAYLGRLSARNRKQARAVLRNVRPRVGEFSVAAVIHFSEAGLIAIDRPTRLKAELQTLKP